ncbi:MAG: hypothetical protein ACRYGI_13230 [Janthinobacterium lividum]
MVENTKRTKRDHLTLKDKLVAICIATILIAIVLAIFRLGIAALYG